MSFRNQPSWRTLGDVLVEAAETNAFGVRFWSREGRHLELTYRDVFQRARAVAGELVRRGVRPGDRVILVLPTSPEFLDAFFGCLLSGAVPCALYPPVRLGRIDEWKTNTARMIRGIDAVLVLTGKRIFNLLGYPVREARPVLGCACVDELGSGELLSDDIPLEPEDLAFIQYSSGSTGFPKPVAISHRNVLANAEAILASFPLATEEMSCVSWLPLYHDMGLVGTVICALVSRRPLTLLAPELFIAHPVEWLRAIHATRATITVAPNFAFNYCCRKIEESECEGLDLSCLTVALCGSETVHAGTLECFARRFGRYGLAYETLTPVYGMAEATLALTFSEVTAPLSALRFEEHALDLEGRAVEVQEGGVELTSVGKPLQGIELSVRDPGGKACTEGTVGELWARGPSIMRDYHGLPAETSAVLVEGWLRTGDRGFLYRGELFLCGRFKDLVIINGRNHDPTQIEHALYELEALRKGCCVAFSQFSDKTGTEELVVLAEVKQQLSIEELRRFTEQARTLVQSRTGITPAVVEALPRDSLPRTSSGKIRRGETHRRWLKRELSPEGSFRISSMLKEQLKGRYDQLVYARDMRRCPREELS